MKTLFTSLILSFALLHQAHGTQGLFLQPLRMEIGDQLAAASNAPARDKKLITALNQATKVLDRTPPTNLVSSAKSLAAAANTLNRTSLSNEFDPILQSTVDTFLNAILGVVVGAHPTSLSNRLSAAFPSGPRTAAQNNLNQTLALAGQANATANTTVASKLISAAVKKLVVTAKLVNKAESVPPPPSKMKATITASGEGTFTFQPTPASAAVASRIVNLLTITGVQIQRIGTTSIRTRTINITIPNIMDGTRTYTVGPNDGNHATVLYSVSQGGLGGVPSGDAYAGTSGTVTVTWNSATRTAVGTFSFSGNGQNNPGNTASSNNGVFSAVSAN